METTQTQLETLTKWPGSPVKNNWFTDLLPSSQLHQDPDVHPIQTTQTSRGLTFSLKKLYRLLYVLFSCPGLQQ